MQEQRVTLETAKLAKEKGFDIDTGHYYVEGDGKYIFDLTTTQKKKVKLIYSPTQSLLQKWLREKHLIVTNNSTLSNYFSANKETGEIDINHQNLEKGLQIALGFF